MNIDGKFLIREEILKNLQQKIVYKFDLKSAPLFHALSSTTVKFLLTCGYIPGATNDKAHLVSKGDLFVYPSPYFDTSRLLGTRLESLLFNEDMDNIEWALRNYASVNETVYNLINYLNADIEDEALNELLMFLDPSSSYRSLSRRELYLDGAIELISHYCNIDPFKIVQYLVRAEGKGFIIGLEEEILEVGGYSKGDDIYDLRISLPIGGLTVDYIKWIMPLGQRETELLLRS